MDPELTTLAWSAAEIERLAGYYDSHDTSAEMEQGVARLE